MFNGLLGPFILTSVNLKKRPAITPSASYGLGSCSLLELLLFLAQIMFPCYSDKTRQNSHKTNFCMLFRYMTWNTQIWVSAI